MAADAADAQLVLLGEEQRRSVTSVDRRGLQLLLLRQVRGGLAEPGEGDPDREEGHEDDAPPHQFLEQRGLEGGVGGSRTHPARDVLGLLFRPAAQVQREPGGEHQHPAQDEEEDAPGVRGCQHAVRSSSLARRHAEGALRGLVGRVRSARPTRDISRQQVFQAAEAFIQRTSQKV